LSLSLSLSLSSLLSSPIMPSRRAVFTVSGGEEVRKCDIKPASGTSR
jgi:hypothetical protein